MKLNIGCGRDYKQGWWNSDIGENVFCDQRHDIRTENLPHEDGSVTLIYISGVLEQIGPNEELIHAMNECHRVLCDGGIMQVVVPNAKYAIAHRDPMDIRKFTPETFQYFMKDTQEYKLYGYLYGFKGWSELAIDENARGILTITMKK